MSKVVLDFRALIGDPLTLADCRKLRMPACLLAGTNSPAPPRLLVDVLCKALPRSVRLDIDAGHMGPVTHAPEVSALIGDFILHQERQDAMAAGF